MEALDGIKNDAERTEGWIPRVGDLVWAHVRSHPWWPAVVFDPNKASSRARAARRPDHLLIAFFGDDTFNWLRMNDLRPFIDQFAERIDASSTSLFLTACAQALYHLDTQTFTKLTKLCKSNEFVDERNKVADWVRQRALTLPGIVKEIGQMPEAISCRSDVFLATKIRAHLLSIRSCISASENGIPLKTFLRPPPTPASENDVKSGLISASDRKGSRPAKLNETSRIAERSQHVVESAVKTSDSPKKRRNKEDRQKKGLIQKKLKMGNGEAPDKLQHTALAEPKFYHSDIREENIEVPAEVLSKSEKQHKGERDSNVKSKTGPSTSSEVEHDEAHSVPEPDKYDGPVEEESLAEKDSEGKGTDDVAETVKAGELRGKGLQAAGDRRWLQALLSNLLRLACCPDSKWARSSDQVHILQEQLLRMRAATYSKSMSHAPSAETELDSSPEEMPQVPLPLSPVSSPRSTEPKPVKLKVKPKKEPPSDSVFSAKRERSVSETKAHARSRVSKAIPPFADRPHGILVASARSPPLDAKKRSRGNDSTDAGRSAPQAELESSKAPALPTQENGPQVLKMSFPEQLALPSEMQLRALFTRYGPLVTGSTRVYRHSKSAQVVFQHANHAASAFAAASQTRLFGSSAVRFWLRNLQEPRALPHGQASPASMQLPPGFDRPMPSVQDQHVATTMIEPELTSTESIPACAPPAAYPAPALAVGAVASSSQYGVVPRHPPWEDPLMPLPVMDQIPAPNLPASIPTANPLTVTQITTQAGSGVEGNIQEGFMSLLQQVSVLIHQKPS